MHASPRYHLTQRVKIHHLDVQELENQTDIPSAIWTSYVGRTAVVKAVDISSGPHGQSWIYEIKVDDDPMSFCCTESELRPTE